MGNEFEVYRDRDGNNHLVFDQSALYDDSQIGDKLEDFEVLRILGSFNNKNPISKVRCLKNNKIYSMKKIDLREIPYEEEYLFKEQMKKLISLNHPHLLKYYKTFEDKKNNILYLVYEFMNNSDLNSLIMAHALLKQPIKEEIIWNILLQCLSGLNYLHKENLASLAIRPTNIYLNNEQNAKISLFFNLPKLSDKDYDIQNDILIIGKYFYKMCFSDQIDFKSWIDDFQIIERQNSKYSPELINIVNIMVGLGTERKKTSEIFKLVKDEYVKKYTKVTSIDSVLRCLYSLPNFNQAINDLNQAIKANEKKNYISYWFLKSIEAIKGEKIKEEKIKDNSNLKVCYEEFRRVLAAENSKIDCSKEVDPVFLFAFLLEKMHKELNRKNIIAGKNIDQYVVNAIYRKEEKDNESDKNEMLKKFNTYTQDNLNSVISNLFYGITKVKRLCKQCKNGFYSFNNVFCSAFDLTKCDENKLFDLKPALNRVQLRDKSVCEVCQTEQTFDEFDDNYKNAQHLVVCFYRGIDYQNNTQIQFTQEMNLTEIKGHNEKLESKKYELIGTVNRILKNNEEEFTYFCRDLSKKFWYSKDGILNNFSLDTIKNCGQTVMLFYNHENEENQQINSINPFYS